MQAFRPFRFADSPRPIGAVPLPLAEVLLARGLLSEKREQLILAGQAPSERLEDLRLCLRDADLIGPFRDEAMPVLDGPNGEEMARVDRSALRPLGFWAQKVHVNGFIPGDAPALWLSCRSRRAEFNPLRFDTLVAGGRPCDTTLDDTVRKESWEEAGLTEPFLAPLTHVRDIAVQYVSARGLHQELLVIHDLPLSPDFLPECQDEEIEHFHCNPMTEVAAMLRERPETFKYSSWLVTRDFLLRQGYGTALSGQVGSPPPSV